MSKLPISEEDYDKVEAFLSGPMNEAERQAFEGELEANPRLKAAFEDYKMVIEALADEEAERMMRNLMEGWAKDATEVQEDAPAPNDSDSHAPQPAETEPGKRKFRRSRWRLIIPAAAALALATWVGIRHFSAKTDTDLFIKYFQTDPRAPYNLGPAEVNEGRMAMGAYLHGNFEEADRKFILAREKAPLDDTLRYFHGITLLALTRAADAIATLNPLVVKPSGFRQMSRWYVALALIHEGRETEALPELRAIEAEPSHPMQQQAVELVKEISAR